MEQDTDTTTGGGFVPAPMTEILRSEPSAAPTEPAGRPEPEAAPTAASEPGEKPAEAPRAEQPRQSDGKFAPKDAAAQGAGPPPAEQKEPPQTVPLSAVLEERKKRQALEARLRELEARAAPSQPPAPVPQAAPEVPLEDLMFQDPQRFLQAIQKPFEERLVETRIVMSEQVARQQPDYEQAESALMAYLESNPAAKAQAAQIVRSHPAPALWALEQGRAVLAQQKWGQVIQQYGSPEAYAEALRASQPAPAPAQPVASPSPAVPPASLASVRSAAPRSGAAPWTGPTPLSAILGPRR